MKKLRLIMFEACPRNCEGCCNKDWDLGALPVCTDFSDYDQVMLTGGEPMLRPDLVEKTALKIRKQNPVCDIYMYTALTKDIPALLCLLRVLNGICVTLHEPCDVALFKVLNSILIAQGGYRCRKSLRLNVFKGVDIEGIDVSPWKVKRDIEWIKDCPLPADEVLMRLSSESGMARAMNDHE